MTRQEYLEKTREAFLTATSVRKYRAALQMAGRLRGRDQMLILDALLASAKKLNLTPETAREADPVGMTQCLDGSVVVTWETLTKRPDGSNSRVMETATLEPVKSGPGWCCHEPIPAEVVDAVNAASLSDQLPRTKRVRKRIYVR